MSRDPFLIYGATGYTGKLIAREAVSRGLKPILGGRNPDTVQALARELDLDWLWFDVDDRARMEQALARVHAVLSVAGPFSATARQLMNGCIMAQCHYLDVTGEIDVFELAAGKHGDAGAAGVVLMPGVGFDVVPSDCIAAHTAARATSPQALRLAIKGLGGPSRGTAKTGVEALGSGLSVRKDGTIVKKRAGSLRRKFDLGAGPEDFVGVSWGDVSTAYHSTGIGDIEAYFPYAGPIKSMTRMARLAGPILKLRPVQNALKRQIDKMPAGPSEADRAAGGAEILAEVTDADGTVWRSKLDTPNGYSLTAEAAVAATTRVLTGDVTAGFQTPAKAFGAGFVETLAGCTITDL